MKHHDWIYENKISPQKIPDRMAPPNLGPVCLGAVVWYVCGIAGAILLVLN